MVGSLAIDDGQYTMKNFVDEFTTEESIFTIPSAMGRRLTVISQDEIGLSYNTKGDSYNYGWNFLGGISHRSGSYDTGVSSGSNATCIFSLPIYHFHVIKESVEIFGCVRNLLVCRQDTRSSS